MRTIDADPTSRLVRDVARFQLKLWMEALRDVVLIPVSLGAAALDLLLSRQQKPRFFREVIRVGRRSDDWIDLWATVDGGRKAENVDALMERVERALRDPRTGTRQARALKRWLERQVRRQVQRGTGPAEAGETSDLSPPPPPPPPGG